MSAKTTSTAVENSVLVTLADANYVDQAKQLFSAAYHRAGWRGSYLLLAHEIPEEELSWFEQRGILVKRCEPLFEGKPGGMPAVLTSKFYLFAPEFKRWETVIYCDADATIRASIDELASLRGFWTIVDASRWVWAQVISKSTAKRRGISPGRRRQLVRQVKRIRKLSAPCFCAGFLVFSTDLIDDETFDELRSTLERFGEASEYGEQLTWNLVFRDVWRPVSPIYNVQVRDEWNQWRLAPDAIEGIIIHYIASSKPWMNKNAFYKEWKENLEVADALDLSNIPPGEVWSEEKRTQATDLFYERDLPTTYVKRRIRTSFPESMKWILRTYDRFFRWKSRLRTSKGQDSVASAK